MTISMAVRNRSPRRLFSCSSTILLGRCCWLYSMWLGGGGLATVGSGLVFAVVVFWSEGSVALMFSVGWVGWVGRRLL
jgi:hypothetical protein